MVKSIEIKEITGKIFQTYGQVIKKPNKKEWSSSIVDYWSNLGEIDFEGKKAEINLGVAKKRKYEFKEVERHLDSPEMLISTESDIILPVAEDEKAENIEAFLIKSGQAVILKTGVWHASPFPVKTNCQFLVIYKKSTIPEDKNVKELETKIRLNF